MFRPESVLALAAHPDDVEPQAGGTLAMWNAAGIPVTLISVVTCPLKREAEGKAAAAALGIRFTPYRHFAQELRWFNNDDLVDVIENGKGDIPPLEYDTVITPSEHDSHPDHQKVAALGYQLARRNRVNLLQMSHAIPGGVSGHPFPNFLVQLDPTAVASKSRALNVYGDRLKSYRANIADRDMYYGSLMSGGVAEGFTILKAVSL